MSTDSASNKGSAADKRRRRPKRGIAVYVKPGSRHPIYPDLPIGGWSGVVERIQRSRDSNERRCWVHFSQSTTDRLHPIYAERERRDNPEGCDLWDNWLPADVLEVGEALPETIEQPELPDWAQHAGNRQVRKLFGLGPDDAYPDCTSETAEVWKRFLSEHIRLPRRIETTADCDDESAEVVLQKLLGPDEVDADVEEDSHGLYAEVTVDGATELTRLEDVLFLADDPHDTLLRDYVHWFEIVHGGDFWPASDPAESEEMSPEEFDAMWRSTWTAAWKAQYGRAPSDAEMEMGSRMLDDLLNPGTATPRPLAVNLPVDSAVEEPVEPDVIEPIRAGPRIGRNDPCPCGSGKKYKKCCLRAT